MVSVIVPIYNAEKYVGKCIESVLNQTYTDFQLILVNDGSKDGSLAVCKSYNDPRIKVVHKKNGGVSSARNCGIENVNGEWVTFLDSDDSFEPEFLEGLLPKEDCDFVVGGYRWVGDFDEKWYVEKYQILNKKDLMADMLNFEYADCGDMKLRTVFLYPWGKLYRSSFLQEHGLRFNEKMKVGEDFCFVLQYASYCRNILMVDSNCYNYLVINGRQNYMLDANQLYDHITGFNDALGALEKSLGTHLEITRRFMTKTILNLFMKHLKRSNDYKSYANEVDLYQQKSAVFFANYLRQSSAKEKVKILIPLKLPLFYYLLMKAKNIWRIIVESN